MTKIISYILLTLVFINSININSMGLDISNNIVTKKNIPTLQDLAANKTIDYLVKINSSEKTETLDNLNSIINNLSETYADILKQLIYKKINNLLDKTNLSFIYAINNDCLYMDKILISPCGKFTTRLFLDKNNKFHVAIYKSEKICGPTITNKSFKLECRNRLEHLTYSSDSRYLAFIFTYGDIIVYDLLESKKILKTNKFRNSEILYNSSIFFTKSFPNIQMNAFDGITTCNISFTSDNNLLIKRHFTKEALLINLNGELIKSYKSTEDSEKNFIRSCNIIPNTNNIALISYDFFVHAAGALDLNKIIIEFQKDGQVIKKHIFNQNALPRLCVSNTACNSQGTYFAFYLPNTIVLCDAQNGEIINSYRQELKHCAVLQFSSCGNYLLTVNHECNRNKSYLLKSEIVDFSIQILKIEKESKNIILQQTVVLSDSNNPVFIDYEKTYFDKDDNIVLYKRNLKDRFMIDSTYRVCIEKDEMGELLNSLVELKSLKNENLNNNAC